MTNFIAHSVAEDANIDLEGLPITCKAVLLDNDNDFWGVCFYRGTDTFTPCFAVSLKVGEARGIAKGLRDYLLH